MSALYFDLHLFVTHFFACFWASGEDDFIGLRRHRFVYMVQQVFDCRWFRGQLKSLVAARLSLGNSVMQRSFAMIGVTGGQAIGGIVGHELRESGCSCGEHDRD